MSEMYCGDDELRVDEACLQLKSTLGEPNTWLYSLSSDCSTCPYKRVAEISLELNTSIKLITTRSMKWRVIENDGHDEFISVKNNSNIICELTPRVTQFGLYELSVQNNSCKVTTISDPINPYTPLLIAFAVIVIFLLGTSLSRSLRNVLRTKCMKNMQERVIEKTIMKRRIKSIDTFRGISILAMIFVNGGAGGYYLLQHATWNGLLVGDLVFPCFMWIMGVCIPIAINSQINRGVTKYSVFNSIIRRSLLLFLIGVSLNTLGTGPRLETMRIFGVLQRFSITYLFVALLFLFFTARKHASLPGTLVRVGIAEDISCLIPHWLIILLVVIAHCALTFRLPIPGCPRGYLGPGGIHEDGQFRNCTGGAAGYIDKLILGNNHIYQKPAISEVYESGPFDPEGILGCLTSILQVFLGLQAGMISIVYKDWKKRVIRWLLWAMVLGCSGCALHFTNVIPVNKNLWSISFVFVTTAFALALLSGCYLLIDVVSVWRGGPFRIPGMNALIMYVGHQLCYNIFPFHWRIGKMNSHGWYLLETLWGVVLWVIIAYILHRKRVYVSL